MQNPQFNGPYFFVKPVADAAPEAAGIYMLLGPDDGTGNHTVFYVGQTNNFRDRLKAHINENTKWRALHYVYHFESSQLGRNVLEKELIEKYKPLYNDKLNPIRSLSPSLTPKPQNQLRGVLGILQKDELKKKHELNGVIESLLRKKI